MPVSTSSLSHPVHPRVTPPVSCAPFASIMCTPAFSFPPDVANCSNELSGGKDQSGRCTSREQVQSSKRAWLTLKDDATQAMHDDRQLITKSLMTQAEYDQEWYLSIDAAIKGAYYTAELTQARQDGRITRVPYDPALPVDTDWDLGVGDSTAIWFSQSLRSGEVRVIDYYEASGEGLPHYARVLKDRGYVYGQHWAPHDIAVREFSSGKSRLDIAASLGIPFQIVPQLPLDDGVNAVRLLLPRCWFDVQKCEAGLEVSRTIARPTTSVSRSSWAPPCTIGPPTGRMPFEGWRCGRSRLCERANGAGNASRGALVCPAAGGTVGRIDADSLARSQERQGTRLLRGEAPLAGPAGRGAGLDAGMRATTIEVRRWPNESRGRLAWWGRRAWRPESPDESRLLTRASVRLFTGLISRELLAEADNPASGSITTLIVDFSPWPT